MSIHNQQYENARSDEAILDLLGAYGLFGQIEDVMRIKNIVLALSPIFQRRISILTQRELMLLRLRHRPICAKEARKIGIKNAAARVKELRRYFGHNIKTIWIPMPTPSGRLRRVAVYQLKPE